MKRDLRDTLVSMLTDYGLELDVAEPLAVDIQVVSNRWKIWMDIVSGRHSCYHEQCACDRVIAYAGLVGWSDR